MSLQNGDKLPSERQDWPFIQNGAVTLFLKQRVLDEAVKVLMTEGYAIETINCGDDAAMIADLSRALHWEEQFGYAPTHLNLDALNDALRGEPCTARPRVVLVFKAFGAYFERAARKAQAIADIIEHQSRNHLIFAQRLLAFLHVDDPRTEFAPLGGRAPMWNTREWLMRDRGI